MSEKTLNVVESKGDIETARRVLHTESMALEELSKALTEDFMDAIDMFANVEGRVIVTGMGKSGHIARKIAATMASTGTPAFFVHPGEASHGDMGMIVRGDVVLALSNSGEVRELSDLIEYTRRHAIPLIGMTSNPNSTLGERSDVAIVLPPFPEACPNGLAPTTSTTMMIALGDAIAITLLERKGFSPKDYKIFHPGGKLGQQLMEVSEIMHTGDAVPLVGETAPIREMLDIMTVKGFGVIGITAADGTLAGIVTDGDLRRNIGPDLLEKTAGDIMTRTPKIISPDTLVGEAMGIMNDVKNEFRKITCLFVTDDDNRPAGVLHVHDCLRAGFA